jgi:uroporphyrinogen decarboxylase
MHPRERVLAAIDHRPADRIPIDAIHIEIQPQLAATLCCDPVDVLDALGVDGRIVAAPYRWELPPPQDGVPFTPWGVRDTGDYGTAHAYPLAAVESVREVETYAWPNPELYDYTAAARLAHEWGGRYAVRGPYWEPVFSRACELMGMEQAMIRMLTEPLLFDAVLEHIYMTVAAISERLLDACGDDMPIYCLGDDFATQRGLMVSPEKWRCFVKPRLAGLFALAKARGKKVWFHSCGDVTAVLPDLIDIGMDVWETVQLHTLPMSATELKRAYGRDITFFGGINTQRLPFAQPTEIEAEVAQVIEALGLGGGYICRPDHHIKPDVPVANALALFATALAFHREGYTLSSRARSA